MNYEDLELFPNPEKVIMKDTKKETRAPYERIKAYNDKEYELFIREWVVSLKDRYQVRGFGGSGDKGRDVIAKDNLGKYYYYQCKHYDHPLTPSDVYTEFGKLIYYTFNRDIPLPCEYYIMGPHDIGAKLNDLIENPQKINNDLLDKWDKYCKTKICSKQIILSDDLKKYIENFDFSIVKTKTMIEVVEEHKHTAFYAFRFGGGLTVKRDRSKNIPQTTQKVELRYIIKLLQAIAEKEGISELTLEDLNKNYVQYLNILNIQRERFFSAENLKVFTKKHLMIDDYFEELKEDIYYGICDYMERIFTNGYERMNVVLSSVTSIDLNHNLLVKYGLVYPQDRQGICHHLANEREDIVWTNKK